MADGSPEMIDRLARLSRAFVTRSLGDASRLSELRGTLATSDPGALAATVGEIEAIAHRLHGSAGTLGFAEIGEAAAALEDVIGALSDQPDFAGDRAHSLEGPMEQLLTAIHRASRDQGP